MSDRVETAISPHPSKHSCTDISELEEVKTKDMEVNVPSASVAEIRVEKKGVCDVNIPKGGRLVIIQKCLLA
jgi:hypothetical protein